MPIGRTYSPEGLLAYPHHCMPASSKMDAMLLSFIEFGFTQAKGHGNVLNRSFRFFTGAGLSAENSTSFPRGDDIRRSKRSFDASTMDGMLLLCLRLYSLDHKLYISAVWLIAM